MFTDKVHKLGAIMTHPSAPHGPQNYSPSNMTNTPTPPPKQPTPQQPKPLYKAGWFIVLTISIVLIILVSLLNTNDDYKDNKSNSGHSYGHASPAPAPNQTPTLPPNITVPNLVGMRGDVAQATLRALGETNIVFKDETGHKMVLKVSNWTVTSQIPEAGTTTSTDNTITLFVHHDTDDAKPTDNPTTEAPSTTDPKKDDVPRDYRKALKSAESYSKTLHMSKQGIYDQLTSEFEGFSPEAAQYAIDNIQADWNANALAKAKEYEKSLNMSDEAIREQLVSEYGEQFTQEEADYAISHLDD